MSVSNGLTPTEKRLRQRLDDGYPHSYSELLKLLDDDLATPNVLAAHICNLRTKLPEGEVVSCVLAAPGVKGYVLFRLPAPAVS